MIINPGLIRNSGGRGLLNQAGFWLPLNDAGSGAVNTTLARGTGSATFTRSTIATTIGSTGLIVQVASGVARSYYDPTTLSYQGYLAEGARTNLLLRSEEFDNASWIKTDTTITANSIASPDGATTADLLTEGSAGTALVSQSVTATADVTYTVSRFFKVGNTPWVRLQTQENATNFIRGWFNLSTGAVGSAANGGTGSAAAVSIKAYPNGWYRCTLSGVVGNAATAIASFSSSASADASTTRVSGATRYEWGAQFENNVTFSSSYIPTVAASVTRNADVLTFPFSGNADATVGSMYVEATPLGALTVIRPLLALDNNTAAERNSIVLSSGTGQYIVTDNSVNQATINVSYGTENVLGKYASSYSENLFKFAAGGTSGTDDTSGMLPTPTQIAIGVDQVTANRCAFSAIKNVRVWQTQFTAAQLQAITS